MNDALMKQNKQGRVYDKKPATIKDIANDRNPRIWKAFCSNIDSEPTYADMGKRFGVSPHTIRKALEAMAIPENIKKLDSDVAVKVLSLMKQRKVSCNRRGK